MLSVGVLCSGKLGLETLVLLLPRGGVEFVMTDKGSTAIIESCAQNGIPCFAGNPRKGKGYEFIKNFSVDVIASINYLFLIEKDIIGFPKILAFNIHGSLLPKYRGRTPHVWAIINGEKNAGITAHIIDEDCDTGDIIEQIVIPIGENDTGGLLLSKYEKEYGPLVFRILDKIEKGELSYQKQDGAEATYFPKRTPDDGEIQWDWQAERIRNWVRAQAFPYPGAFTYYEGEKVIVDRVEKSDLGLDGEIPNGTILAIDPKTIVKCNNGCLSLVEIRSKNTNFQIGKKFEYENRK